MMLTTTVVAAVERNRKLNRSVLLSSLWCEFAPYCYLFDCTNMNLLGNAIIHAYEAETPGPTVKQTAKCWLLLIITTAATSGSSVPFEL